MKLCPFVVVAIGCLGRSGQMDDVPRAPGAPTVQRVAPPPSPTRGEVRLQTRAHFDSQVQDVLWSKEAESELEAVTAKAGPGTHHISAKCRQTLCVVRAEHDTRAAQRAFTALLSNHEPFRSRACTYFYDFDRPPYRTEAYVARDGFDVPAQQSDSVAVGTNG